MSRRCRNRSFKIRHGLSFGFRSIMRRFYKFLTLSSLFTICFIWSTMEEATLAWYIFDHPQEEVVQPQNSGNASSIDAEKTDSIFHTKDGKPNLEPGAFAVFGIGLLGLMAILRRRVGKSNYSTHDIPKPADISGTKDNERLESRPTLRNSAFKLVTRLSQCRW